MESWEIPPWTEGGGGFMRNAHASGQDSIQYCIILSPTAVEDASVEPCRLAGRGNTWSMVI